MEDRIYDTVSDNTEAINKNSEVVEIQFSMVDIVNMMIAFWWLIAMLGILIGGGTYAYTKITAIPEYKSEGTLYVNTAKEQTTDDVNAVAIRNAAELLPTYIEVLTSTPFMELVADDIDNKYSIDSLGEMIEFTALEETNLIDVKVVTADSHDAYLITRSILRNAPAKIQQIFEGGSVKIIEYPEEAEESEADSAFQKGIIGFIAGAAIAMIIIFLINLFDTRVKGSEELTTKYGLPVLGEVPNLIDL